MANNPIIAENIDTATDNDNIKIISLLRSSIESTQSFVPLFFEIAKAKNDMGIHGSPMTK